METQNAVSLAVTEYQEARGAWYYGGHTADKWARVEAAAAVLTWLGIKPSSLI